MSEAERGFFEPRFKRDFEGIRIHRDAEASSMAERINAQAFTRGGDIYFASGKYQPETDSGRRLIAHELAHTVQQGASGPVQDAPDALSPVRPSPVAASDSPSVASPASPVQSSADSHTADSLAPFSSPARSSPAHPSSVQSSAAAVSSGPEISSGPSSMLQRDDAAAADGGSLETGKLEGDTIKFASIELPAFKVPAHTAHLPLRQPKNYTRGDTDQRSKWREQVGAAASGAISGKLSQKIAKSKNATAVDATGPYVFTAPSKYGTNPPRYFIGSLADISKEMSLPSWGASGAPKSLDVDHKVELQLAGWSGGGWANEIGNMELLESGVNSSSGSTIKNNIDKKIAEFVKSPANKGESASVIKDKYNLEFNSATAGGGGKEPTPDDRWSKEQISSGEHVGEQVIAGDMNLLGGDGFVSVFPGQAGGVPKKFSIGGAVGDDRNWVKPFRLTGMSFKTDVGDIGSPDLGTLNFEMPAGDKHWEPFACEPMPITRFSGARYAGHIDKQQFRSEMRKLHYKKASPIEVDEMDISPVGGLCVSGRIVSDIPLLKGCSLDFTIENGELTLRKEFSIGDFQVPAPFKVSDCSLVISVGTGEGLAAEGKLDFEIQRVGKGSFQASAGTSGKLGFTGIFDFDTKLFEPARLTLTYADDQLSGEGVLGIPAGRVKGIRSATASVSYSEGKLDATGKAELEVPGVSEGNLSLSYSEAEGLAISGSLQLSDQIPGIRGGSLEASLSQKEGGEGYKLAASGTAVPAIPGIGASISAVYDDGAIEISGEAAYSRGLLSGSIRVGATNRPVDQSGMPVPGGEPTGALRAFGGGSLALKLAPWLQATATVRILQNGELEVSGEVGLPDALNLFDEKAYQKELFNIGLDIPIVGVAVAGQRIGIFATIRGGLGLSASVGPGQLRALSLSVTYNPDHEDQTAVHGGAELYIPAKTGLRLFVRGALGAGIPIVSAEAGIEVGGELGLEGSLVAGVSVDWSPAKGLVLDAEASLSAQPKFKFDVTGYVLVQADLVLTTIELYNRRWQLAAFEYGSDLRFGVKFPVHYEEGKPFDVSWDQVQFEVPNVNPQELLTGLVKRIAA